MTEPPFDLREFDALLDRLSAKYRPGERERTRLEAEAFFAALPPGTSQALAFRAYKEMLRTHRDALPKRRRWWTRFFNRGA